MSGAGAFLKGVTGGYMAGEKIEQGKELSQTLDDLQAMRHQSPDAGRGVIDSPGTGVKGTTFVYDGKINDRVTHAFNRFTQAGVPREVAAGLVGNLMQESGAEIDPAAVGDNGNAFGAAQHNGPRRHALFAFADAKGVDPTDFDAQIDFILHEGKTTEKKAWDAILAAPDAASAARIASERFWRPGTPHVERRVGYANSVYERLASQTPASETKERGVLGVLDAGERLLKNFYNKES